MNTQITKEECLKKAIKIISLAFPKSPEKHQIELINAVLETVYETASNNGFDEAAKHLDDIKNIEEQEEREFDWEKEGLGELL